METSPSQGGIGTDRSVIPGRSWVARRSAASLCATCDPTPAFSSAPAQCSPSQPPRVGPVSSVRARLARPSLLRPRQRPCSLIGHRFSGGSSAHPPGVLVIAFQRDSSAREQTALAPTPPSTHSQFHPPLGRTIVARDEASEASKSLVHPARQPPRPPGERVPPQHPGATVNRRPFHRATKAARNLGAVGRISE
jgi:hypothetical protein